MTFSNWPIFAPTPKERPESGHFGEVGTVRVYYVEHVICFMQYKEIKYFQFIIRILIDVKINKNEVVKFKLEGCNL